MGKKSVEKKIDGEIYTIYMLKPKKSLKLLSKIVKLIGPSIGKAFPNEVKIKEIFDANINISDAVVTFSDKFDDDRVQDIINILFDQVHHAGEGSLSNEEAYSNLFSGRIKHLFKVVFASMEVQYADFFDGKDFFATILQKSKEIETKN